MDRTPHYLDWDHRQFVFAWPKRLANFADQINKLHAQALSLGYLVGVGAAKSWDYNDTHCMVAAASAWIALILPKTLEGTAMLWIRFKGVKMMYDAYNKELPQLSAAQANEHRVILERKCAELRKRTGD